MNKSLEITKQNLKVRSSISKIKTDKVTLNNFDPKILDFIVVLNHLGFNTFSSCQGHVDGKKIPRYFPFVLMCNNYSENADYLTEFTGDKDELFKQYQKTLKSQAKLIEYLDQFYENSTTELRYRLSVKLASRLRFSIEPYSRTFGSLTDDINDHTQLNNRFLEEINSFTEFLKTKIK